MMARLDIPSHPHRIFKDAAWLYGPRHCGLYGYLSLAEYSDTPSRYGALWAFAVEEPAAWPESKPLYDDDVVLAEPFIAAEIVQIGDTRYVIGFFAEPDDEE